MNENSVIKTFCFTRHLSSVSREFVAFCAHLFSTKRPLRNGFDEESETYPIHKILKT